MQWLLVVAAAVVAEVAVAVVVLTPLTILVGSLNSSNVSGSCSTGGKRHH